MSNLAKVQAKSSSEKALEEYGIDPGSDDADAILMALGGDKDLTLEKAAAELGYTKVEDEKQAPKSGGKKSALATKESASTKLAKPEVNLGGSDVQAADTNHTESGRKVGETVVYNQANSFNLGVTIGAQEAMGQARAATESLVKEVEQQSADYFRGIAAQFGVS